MSLLFFLHSLNQPSRLASPAFTRRSMFRQLVGLLMRPIGEPLRQYVRQEAVSRRRDTESCHFQLRAL